MVMTSEKIRIRCPYCKRKLKVKPRAVGTDQHCPNCDGIVHISAVNHAEPKPPPIPDISVQHTDTAWRMKRRWRWPTWPAWASVSWEFCKLILTYKLPFPTFPKQRTPRVILAVLIVVFICLLLSLNDPVEQDTPQWMVDERRARLHAETREYFFPSSLSEKRKAAAARRKAPLTWFERKQAEQDYSDAIDDAVADPNATYRSVYEAAREAYKELP